MATKPSRLWATVQEKLNQLTLLADSSGYDYLCARINYLEQEVAALRAEIGAGQLLRNGDRKGVQSSHAVELIR